MKGSHLPGRVVLFAASFGVAAVIGTVPALAAPGENIFGSGAALQKIIQQNVWTGDWSAYQSGLTGGPFTDTYTATSSGDGLAEFGNTTGALNLAQDPTADSGSTNGYGTPVLDGYTATDDAPTPADLTDASTAATGGASSTISEVTIPVAQEPLALVISLPSGITVGGTTSRLKLKTGQVENIYNQTVPASTHYPVNTWGAVLEEAGWKRVTANPTVNQFTDAGGTTGGGQAITLQARAAGAGTTFTIRGYLYETGDATYPLSTVSDSSTWPVTVSETGNTSDDALVATTTATPGSLGYAALADAATSAPAYTFNAASTTDGGTTAAHDILYAEVQNNEGATTATYESPAGTTVGSANVYTGNDIDINGANPDFAGQWVVPFESNGTTLNPTGSWAGTLASDPDIAAHGGKSDYPIVAIAIDLGWTAYNVAGSNLVGSYGGTAAQAAAAGASSQSYLKYVVASSEGQKQLKAANVYYAVLPSTIDGYANTAARNVN